MQEQDSKGITKFHVEYADVAVTRNSKAVRFTFFWPEANRWEERDFEVKVAP